MQSKIKVLATMTLCTLSATLTWFLGWFIYEVQALSYYSPTAYKNLLVSIMTISYIAGLIGNLPMPKVSMPKLPKVSLPKLLTRFTPEETQFKNGSSVEIDDLPSAELVPLEDRKPQKRKVTEKVIRRVPE